MHIWGGGGGGGRAGQGMAWHGVDTYHKCITSLKSITRRIVIKYA